MSIGVTILIISVLIVAIWVIIELKRFKHKLFAIFLIGLILFGYFSFTFSLGGQKVDFKTVSGLIEASKLYSSWLVATFGNMKSITANVINMDWKSNETVAK